MMADSLKMATLFPAAAMRPRRPADPLSWVDMDENVSFCWMRHVSFVSAASAYSPNLLWLGNVAIRRWRRDRIQCANAHRKDDGGSAPKRRIGGS
jgi:hypothetical protein